MNSQRYFCGRKSSILTFTDAVRMIRDNIRDPERASERKRAHYNNVAYSEVFFESTPSVLIQLSILVTILSKHNIKQGTSTLEEFVGDICSGTELILFSIGFVSSILSSAFGISRF